MRVARRLRRPLPPPKKISRKGGAPLQLALMTGSLLVVLLVAALVREVRLRRALQLLLRRLLTKWRNR